MCIGVLLKDAKNAMMTTTMMDHGQLMTGQGVWYFMPIEVKTGMSYVCYYTIKMSKVSF